MTLFRMQGNRTLPRLCMKREGSDRNVLNGIVGGDKYRRMFLRCLVREMGAFVLSFVVYSRDRSGQYPLSGDSPDAVCRYVELVRGRIFPLLHGLSGVSRDRPSRARTGQDGPRRSRAEQRSGRDRLRRDRGEIVANRTEPNLTGPSRTEPDRAGPNRTEQDRAGPSRTEQDRTGPNRIEQDRTGPSRTEQDRAGPSRTEQDRPDCPKHAEPGSSGSG